MHNELSKYIPKNSISRIAKWIEILQIDLKFVKPRITKLGDFRYNYNKVANSNILLTFNYSDNNFLINNFNLNFYKVILSNEYSTTKPGDFQNVDCIFKYYNPEKTLDPSLFLMLENLYCHHFLKIFLHS